MSTVLGYLPLEVFDVADDDTAAQERLAPYLEGGYLIHLPDDADPEGDARSAAVAAAAVADGADPTLEQIAAARADDLRDWLTARGLPTSGKVDDLRDRLAAQLDPSATVEQ